MKFKRVNIYTKIEERVKCSECSTKVYQEELDRFNGVCKKCKDYKEYCNSIS